MMRSYKCYFFQLALFSLFTFSSCTNKSDKELNRLIVELADSDATIDREDWMRLEDYLDAKKAHFKDLFKNERLNEEALKTYIQDIFNKRRPTKNIRFIGIGDDGYLKVNFYLERSGSMTPYDSPVGDGSFKSAVVQLLNSLPNANEENKIYVVNSSIEPYPKGFASFIKDNNIFDATKGIGDPSYTDFGAIFNQLINKTGKNELSILITDMIYSIKSMEGVNPQKIFAEARGMINSVFKSAVQGKSMLIVKMKGSYHGLYYPFNSPNSGTNYSGNRPYYIIVVGDNDNMARLTTDLDYASFAKMMDLTGFEHQYLFASSDVYEPYYSLLLGNGEIRGRFHPERGQKNQVTSIEGVEIDSDSGDLRLALAVDLHGMFIDEDYLLNTQNYLVKSDDDFVIKSIRPINKSDLTQTEKKYANSATHLFILSSTKITTDQEVKIKLMNRLPQWVVASSSDDDTNLNETSFATTTFGLKYLLEGIYSSYQKSAGKEPCYFELNLKINK